jgi:hypothetical protein
MRRRVYLEDDLMEWFKSNRNIADPVKQKKSPTQEDVEPDDTEPHFHAFTQTNGD